LTRNSLAHGWEEGAAILGDRSRISSRDPAESSPAHLSQKARERWGTLEARKSVYGVGRWGTRQKARERWGTQEIDFGVGKNGTEWKDGPPDRYSSRKVGESQVI
jgi:hypothetical protein